MQWTIDRAASDGKNFDHEHRLLMPDGSVKDVHVVAHATSDDSGRIEFVGAVTDVTGVKQAEEILRRSETYLHEAQRLGHMGSSSGNGPRRALGGIKARVRVPACCRFQGSKPGPPTSRTRNKSAKAILAETRIYMLCGCGLDLDGVLQTFRIVHLRVVRLQTFRM